MTELAEAKRTLHYLEVAKERISDPARWMKGQYYPGWQVRLPLVVPPPTDTLPCCAAGAVMWATERAGEPTSSWPEIRLLDQAAQLYGHAGVVEYNDHADTTHADVMELFDSAIARARAIVEHLEAVAA